MQPKQIPIAQMNILYRYLRISNSKCVSRKLELTGIFCITIRIEKKKLYLHFPYCIVHCIRFVSIFFQQNQTPFLYVKYSMTCDLNGNALFLIEICNSCY